MVSSWAAPTAQTDRAPALEPIDLPPAIEQGVEVAEARVGVRVDVDEPVHPHARAGASFAQQEALAGEVREAKFPG